MSSEFQKRNINSLCSLISSGGTPSRSRDDYYQNGNIKWLKTKELFDTNIYETEEHITELGLKNSSAKLYPSNTVVMAMYGATVGQLGIMKTEMSTNQACCCMVVNDQIADYRYLFYSLLNNRNELVGLANGAAQQNLNSQTIKDFEILVPSFQTQKKIAHILSTLDDKIELNHKMNQTLEAMAQALFKSWFVDFDPVHVKLTCKDDAELESAAKELGISKKILELFPSEFEESELGMIPKGWEVCRIKEFGTVITDKTPSTQKSENYGDKYPFITIPDLHNQTYVVKTERFLSDEGNSVQSNKLIPKNSLIVSCIATVGLVAINSRDSHTNQQINSIVCHESYLYYLYCMLSTMTDQLIMYGGAGTATLNVNKTTFENIQVIKANTVILYQFLTFIKPLFEKILSNTNQIQTLQKTRDTLLPKLLSGEIDVSEMEI